MFLTIKFGDVETRSEDVRYIPVIQGDIPTHSTFIAIGRNDSNICGLYFNNREAISE